MIFVSFLLGIVYTHLGTGTPVLNKPPSDLSPCFSVVSLNASFAQVHPTVSFWNPSTATVVRKFLAPNLQYTPTKREDFSIPSLRRLDSSGLLVEMINSSCVPAQDIWIYLPTRAAHVFVHVAASSHATSSSQLELPAAGRNRPRRITESCNPGFHSCVFHSTESVPFHDHGSRPEWSNNLEPFTTNTSTPLLHPVGHLELDWEAPSALKPTYRFPFTRDTDPIKKSFSDIRTRLIPILAPTDCALPRYISESTNPFCIKSAQPGTGRHNSTNTRSPPHINSEPSYECVAFPDNAVAIIQNLYPQSVFLSCQIEPAVSMTELNNETSTDNQSSLLPPVTHHRANSLSPDVSGASQRQSFQEQFQAVLTSMDIDPMEESARVFPTPRSFSEDKSNSHGSVRTLNDDARHIKESLTVEAASALETGTINRTDDGDRPVAAESFLSNVLLRAVGTQLPKAAPQNILPLQVLQDTINAKAATSAQQYISINLPIDFNGLQPSGVYIPPPSWNPGEYVSAMVQKYQKGSTFPILHFSVQALRKILLGSAY